MSARPARVPRSINTATRAEVRDVALRLVQGQLPAGLSGHVFVVGAVGSFSSGSLPRALHSTTTTLNGDGMVYRFDLGPERVLLTTRLVRTDDFRLDEGLSAGPRSTPGFGDYGFVRFSFCLGVRNQANTAFLPIPPAEPGGVPRLLITWDAGRPVEIDTATLDVATTVGRRQEWTPEAAGKLALPPIFASAHPAVDPASGEIFTANFGKGLLGLLATTPLFQRPAHKVLDLIREHPRPLRPGSLREGEGSDGEGTVPAEATAPAGSAPTGAAPPWHLRLGILPFMGAHAARRRFPSASHLFPSRFTVLVRWDGRGDLEHFLLRDAQDGRRVGIRQSMHQIAVTDEYVVLLDSAFEIGLSSLLSNFFPDGAISERLRRTPGSLGDRGIDRVERFLRARVTAPNLTVGSVYFVRRADLETTQERSAVKPLEWRVVTARRVDLPGPVVHFLADPDDRGGTRVVLHVVHQSCTDVSLWLSNFDRDFDGNPPAQDLLGMLPAPMDLSRLARYAIDPRTGQVLEHKEVARDPEFWELALLAGPGLGTLKGAPRRHRFAIYYAIGFWSELATEFVFDLYRDDPQRTVSPERVRDTIAAEGRWTQLIRVDLDSLEIVDSYTLDVTDPGPMGPVGRMLGSPQFIPRHEDSDLLDGWISALCYRDAAVDLLIFDAAHLAGGPLCTLALPREVDPGFLLHSAWLPRIGPRQATYRVDPAVDYEHPLRPSPTRAGRIVERIFQQDAVRDAFERFVKSPPE